jgi:hypothetical protein
LLNRRQSAQHRADFIARTGVERSEGFLPLRCQPQEALPTIDFRGLFVDQAALFEVA